MANRCFLSCSDVPGIYPSLADSDFDAERSWVAHGAGCLPLLWLPLFEPASFVRKTFETEEGPCTVLAPVCDRGEALRRLSSRRAFLNSMFAANGGLDDHIDLYLQLIEASDGSWLTAEWDEVSRLHPASAFDEMVVQCVNQLDREDAGAREGLLHLSTVDGARPFVAPSLVQVAGATLPDVDVWNLFRILGESYIRRVPWE